MNKAVQWIIGSISVAIFISLIIANIGYSIYGVESSSDLQEVLIVDEFTAEHEDVEEEFLAETAPVLYRTHVESVVYDINLGAFRLEFSAEVADSDTFTNTKEIDEVLRLKERFLDEVRSVCETPGRFPSIDETQIGFTYVNTGLNRGALASDCIELLRSQGPVYTSFPQEVVEFLQKYENPELDDNSNHTLHIIGMDGAVIGRILAKQLPDTESDCWQEVLVESAWAGQEYMIYHDFYFNTDEKAYMDRFMYDEIFYGVEYLPDHCGLDIRISEDWNSREWGTQLQRHSRMKHPEWQVDWWKETLYLRDLQ